MNLPKFKNHDLFLQAFTHRSFLNETRDKLESNERLEFLGDSILSFIVSQYLYQAYPEFKEGVLTNLRSLLVNTKILAEIARDLEFGKLLRLSKGEEDSKGRENESLLADSFEAFVGALYIDQGLDAAKQFLYDTVIERSKEIVQKKTFKDPKSLLQEYVQARKLNSPVYKVIQEEGPAHARIFTIGVWISNKLMGQGIGKSKQQGEERAAQEAIKHYSSEALEKSTD